MIGKFPGVFNCNQLFFKLNRFIWSVLPVHCLFTSNKYQAFPWTWAAGPAFGWRQDRQVLFNNLISEVDDLPAMLGWRRPWTEKKSVGKEETSSRTKRRHSLLLGCPLKEGLTKDNVKWPWNVLGELLPPKWNFWMRHCQRITSMQLKILQIFILIPLTLNQECKFKIVVNKNYL
jgi:hypothetical protein